MFPPSLPRGNWHFGTLYDAAPPSRLAKLSSHATASRCCTYFMWCVARTNVSSFCLGWCIVLCTPGNVMHFLKAPSALSKSTRRQEFGSDTKRSRPCYLLHTADDAWVFPHSQKDDVSRIALEMTLRVWLHMVLGRLMSQSCCIKLGN